jgi:hypothetical protein
MGPTPMGLTETHTMKTELLRNLPIGTRYQIIQPPASAHDSRWNDLCFIWTKTGKTTSKLTPTQRIGTRHDNRLRVQVLEV